MKYFVGAIVAGLSLAACETTTAGTAQTGVVSFMMDNPPHQFGYVYGAF